MTLFRRLLIARQLTEGRFYRSIKNITGVAPKNKHYYDVAFRHSSAARGKKNVEDNQRLEFLGDAILGAVVAEYLYHKFPEKDEGFLTTLRSKIVSRKSLNTIAKKIGIPKLLKKRLDRHKKAHSIYGDAFEALIGALYLDRGLEKTRLFIHKRIIATYWDDQTLQEHIISYKSTLIEWAQKEKKNFSFDIIEQWGKMHARNFKISVSIDGKTIAEGIGTSKKRAEEEGAKEACSVLMIT